MNDKKVCYCDKKSTDLFIFHKVIDSLLELGQ